MLDHSKYNTCHKQEKHFIVTVISNSYFRAFVFSVLMFVGVVVVSYQKYGPDYLSGQRADIFLSTAGISLAITIAVVGTFSRGEKPWTWLKTGVACFSCWLVTLLVMAFLVFNFIGVR